ncbi:MAG: hypothetical protein SFV15_26580 [Polyangiaceae bacterium]|nr:hypothetical protein [Polyangiaceae bacterium]
MKLGTAIKRIVKVNPEQFRIRLQYTDGFQGEVDLSFLFGAPKSKPLVLEILRGDLFGRCFIESGALAWPNGYELCPDAVRQWIEQGKHRAA